MQSMPSLHKSYVKYPIHPSVLIAFVEPFRATVESSRREELELI